MKDEQIPVHQLEHAEPTVIHSPDQDMTILARWLQRAMEQGPRFWLLAGGVVVALVGLTLLTSGLATSKSAATEAWVDLTQAKTVEDRLKIAEAYPNTPASLWAKLLSAQEEYSNGVEDLTSGTRKETAGPRLTKALELFRAVAKEAPKDSSQAIAAQFGVARALEARNELDEAIKEYRELATKFPNTPEAKQALTLAKALEEPTNIQFYKELYAYKAPANPTPGGIGDAGSMFPGLNLSPGAGPKSFIPNLPVPEGLDAPPGTTITLPPASSVTVPPPVETPKAETPKAETPKAETPKAETPKAETPKAETPKAETPKTETPK